MKIRDDIELGQHSHVGMARTENQDFFGYWEPDEDRLFDLKGRLVVVCDGMGGHSGGEIASRMAVKAIIDEYTAASEENIVEALRASIEGANAIVFGEGKIHEELRGMGTTVTAIVQRRDMVYFGQVGDSRAYLIRGTNMKQMTKDHSLVQQLVDEGLLDKSEMENHPDKNVILRSLGVKPEVEVDVSHVPIAPGDVFLLCSDGLSGLVTDEQMLETVLAGLGNGGSLRKICETLVDMANSAGGHDNITVQLLKVNTTESATTNTAPQETVTAQFTAEEVEKSIAAARAEAAARGDAPATPAASGSDTGPIPAADAAAPAAPAASSLPATQPSMPVPQMAPPPRDSGGLGKLIAGFFLGAVLAGGGLFGWQLNAHKGAAEEAQTAANEARKKASSMGPLARLAKKELEAGEAELEKGAFTKAQTHFNTAAALYRMSSEGSK